MRDQYSLKNHSSVTAARPPPDAARTVLTTASDMVTPFSKLSRTRTEPPEHNTTRARGLAGSGWSGWEEWEEWVEWSGEKVDERNGGVESPMICDD